MPKREESKLGKISYPNKQKKEEQLNSAQYHQNLKFKNIKNIKSQKKKIITRNINYFKYDYFILILINAINLIFLTDKSYFQYMHSSYITLKVKGTGYRQVFCQKLSDFDTVYYPNEIYINDEKQDSINHSYLFNQTYNYVKLIWYNNINSTALMFSECTDIKEIDRSIKF